MSALNRKLRRDLMQMKGQALAIVAVMACGVGTYVMSLTTLRSMETSQRAYYDRQRFAEIFARVKRAPQDVAAQIAEIPGIGIVQTRVVQDVTLDVADMIEPATGRLISVPDVGRPRLNDLYLRQGRWIEPGRSGEVMCGESFAAAHKLKPGDSVRAILNGKLEELRIVGIVLSPEYVISLSSIGALPDERAFGVFWMGYEELANAFDMDGAFNDISATLVRGASETEVLRRIDRLTEPYGGIGAVGREDQLSNRFLSDEISALRGMGMIMPSIFLGVAAFLINVVMTRLIGTQREQVAALKAFGYSKLEIGAHYLKFVLVIALLGTIVGVALGIQLASGLSSLYATFYRFPVFQFVLDPGVLASSLLIAAGAAVVGTLAAVRRAVNLPAAEAMRPEPPPNYRPTVIETIGLQRFFAQPARMVLRNIERRPLKAALSVLGIAMGVAVLVAGQFIEDALDYMIQFGFFAQQRQDVMVNFVEPASAGALYELSRLPGVIRAEPMRSVAVRVRSGSISRRVGITGLSGSASLFRALDDRNWLPVPMPEEGLILSEKLAEVLGLVPGQRIWVEVMEGRRPVAQLAVSGLVREFSGTNIYMHKNALHRLMREGDSLSGAVLHVEGRRMPDLYRQLKQTARVAGVSAKESSVRSFNETQGKNQRTIKFFNVMFACVIAAGVVYNTARISLSERSRELATLRVIGFTRGEISAILLGELAVLTIAALPLGMLLGYGFAWLATFAFNSEMFRIPLVVSRHTYGFACTMVIAAAVCSGLLVRRQLDHLDLVAVLKSKE
jgi:putative ABC transport system permease protein